MSNKTILVTSVDPDEVLSPWQNELRAIYPPFPIMDVYQRQLRNIYGDKEAHKVYKDLLKEDKSLQAHF